MKTPREILLKKHQAVQPKLDRLRGEVLGMGRSSHTLADDKSAALSELEARSIQGRLAFFVGQLWRELILPSRRIWSGLAAAWLVIIFVNLVDSEPETVVTTAQTSPPVPEVFANIQERRRLLAEYMGENTLEQPAEPPRRGLHPRSERRVEFRVV